MTKNTHRRTIFTIAFLLITFPILTNLLQEVSGLLGTRTN